VRVSGLIMPSSQALAGTRLEGRRTLPCSSVNLSGAGPITSISSKCQVSPPVLINRHVAEEFEVRPRCVREASD
jgi:hypothetical protein